jgi:hypothetical protein
MIVAPIPKSEKKRLASLVKFGLLDSPPEKAFDKLAQHAAAACRTPIALIALLDSDRQWFKARVGTSMKESPREMAFCAYTIFEEEIMEVQDMLKDERFQDNPLVKQEPYIGFYAGVPLRTSCGHAIGSLCVLDTRPRQLSQEERARLIALAGEVVNLIEADYEKRQKRELGRHKGKEQKHVLDMMQYGPLIHKTLTPGLRLLKEQFSESFILWKSHTIIANNFCFLKEEGGYLFIAVVDCMDQCFVNPFFGTLIHGYLHKIIGKGTIGTAKILQELHKRLLHMWPQNSSLAQGGISIALCRIDKKRQLLCFSGASQRLYFVDSKNGCHSLKGNHVRLGRKKQDEDFCRFTEESIQIDEGTAFYLLGQDVQQLLAAAGKKGLRQALKKSVHLQEASMDCQSSIILQALIEKNSGEQQNKYDLLVVGFKGLL